MSKSAGVALMEAQELIEKLREELEETNDTFEDKLDDLTAEFEDRIEALENTKDELEGTIDTMKDDMHKTTMEHESFLADLKTAHEKALHDLASNSGDAWEVMEDEEGNEYFSNKINGEVAWEDPRPLNYEGQKLKAEVGGLKDDFNNIKQAFEKSRLMQSALRHEIESLETTLVEERKEKGKLNEVLDSKNKELHTRETKHEEHLRLKQKQNNALIQKHQYRLKQSDNKTLQVRRELSNMRREAKEMMDTLASEMKDTYLAYGHTTPGHRKVWGRRR